jgi:hypothetical protein
MSAAPTLYKAWRKKPFLHLKFFLLLNPATSEVCATHARQPGIAAVSWPAGCSLLTGGMQDIPTAIVRRYQGINFQKMLVLLIAVICGGHRCIAAKAQAVQLA